MTEVVILPGLDGTARLLKGLCSRLAALGVSARAITYPPDRVLSYEELESLVRPQLPTGPFILVGESFSGPLAVRIAANPPVSLVGLVLSTTFARAPVPALVLLAPLVRFAPARPPMSLLSWCLLGRWATPDLLSALREALRSVSPAVLRARAAAALRSDVSALVPRIQFSTLQLVASQDRLLASSAWRSLAVDLPRCRSLTVPGPHMLLQASLEPCAQEIADFALRLDPDSRSTPTSLRGVA